MSPLQQTFQSEDRTVISADTPAHPVIRSQDQLVRRTHTRCILSNTTIILLDLNYKFMCKLVTIYTIEMR